MILNDSQLDKDIKKLKDDTLTKKDIKAAFKILSEVLGVGTVMVSMATVMATLLGPAVGGGVGLLACQYILMKCVDVYADLPSDQREVVAKLCKRIKKIV